MMCEKRVTRTQFVISKETRTIADLFLKKNTRIGKVWLIRYDANHFYNHRFGKRRWKVALFDNDKLLLS